LSTFFNYKEFSSNKELQIHFIILISIANILY